MPDETIDPAEKPAYGQVWRYVPPDSTVDSVFMLIRRTNPGSWIVMFMHENVPVGYTDNPMAGLYDDPDQRIAGYTRIS